MHQGAPMGYGGLLEPVAAAQCGRRRQLPPTPGSPRRCSTPRLLPTPPPPQSPDARIPVPASMLERRPSGRLLPQPPVIEPPVATPAEEVLQTPSPVSPRSPLTPPVVDTPPPTVTVFEKPQRIITPVPTVERKPSRQELVDRKPSRQDDRKISRQEEIIAPSPIGQTRFNGFERSSFDRTSLDTPDGNRSQSSSLSPSIEQIASKSSSDAEDPKDHGLDPALYGVGSPPPSLPDCSPAVASSSSFTGSEPRPTGLGLLHCTLQHFPVRKRLRVNVLKIEGLAGQLKSEMEINAMCKVWIPGHKSGKEQCSNVKRSRDPVFNQEFFFDNICIEDLDTKCVMIGAFHESNQKLLKEMEIGEASVPLREIRELNTKKEVRVVEELKYAVNPKKLGRLHISTCIEKESKRMTINLKKADELPRWGLIGAPDVCVKITLTQGEKVQTKSSRVLKSTTTAVYNEAVMFLISAAPNDIKNMKIVISVHDMARSCTGDDVIGNVYLGTLAFDKTEIEQWKNTIDHPGKEYKAVHHLKLPNSTPHVHVAEEAGGEEEEEYE